MGMQKNLKLWIVNVAAFILGGLLIVTGLINWLVLPRGIGRHAGVLMEIRHLLMDVHAWLGVFFIVVIAIHLKLHWAYIRANLNRSGILKS